MGAVVSAALTAKGFEDLIVGGGTMLVGAAGEAGSGGVATPVAGPVLVIGAAQAGAGAVETTAGGIGLANFSNLPPLEKPTGAREERGPNGGDRNPSDQQRLNEQREARRVRREEQSRQENGQNPRGEKTKHDEANKGPRGERPKGPDPKDRERNRGIDEEHSRVPKGSGGMPKQP